jgi:nucleoside-diphosphate-sugar epimerase
LGFQLAKNLSSNSKITSITILQDSACNAAKEPFASYATDIPNVKIVKADLADESMTASDMQSLLGQSYDYVWDNASKKASCGAGKAVIDCVKEWNSKLLTYVSSAGIYKPKDEFPMPETTPVKDTAGQVEYEKYAVEKGLPFVSFRPQYIYGEKSNKWDYIDWYFDRLVRGEPLPIPGDGSQKVSLTNSEDVASLLASVLNDESAAVGQTFFNCGTDQLVTYDEVALMCAEVAGVMDAKIHHYDDSLGKAKFPFRLTDFYVSPDMAKAKLGWEGAKHSLKEDLTWYFDSYKARGGPAKEMTFVEDKEVLV